MNYEAQDRIDLEAGFFSRFVVKNLGAKWDGYTWYIEKGTPLEPFYNYLPRLERQKIDLDKSEIEAQARGIKGNTVDPDNFQESGETYLDHIKTSFEEQGYQAEKIGIMPWHFFKA